MVIFTFFDGHIGEKGRKSQFPCFHGYSDGQIPKWVEHKTGRFCKCFFLTRIAGFRIRGAVYMAAVGQRSTCYIYSSRVPHNSFFASRGEIVACVGPKGRFFGGMVTEKCFLRVIPDFPGKNGNWFFLLVFDGYVGKKGHVHGSGKRPYRARG